MKTILISLFIFFLASEAIACKVVNWSEAEWTKNSKNIAYGRIFSVHQEAEISELKSAHGIEASLVSAQASKNVKVKVSQWLKGSGPEILETTIHWCGGGEAVFGEFVVLFGSEKSWHSKLASKSLLKVKAALTRH